MNEEIQNAYCENSFEFESFISIQIQKIDLQEKTRKSTDS